MAGDQPSVLLTKRSKLIPSHRGQVSFPGGRIEEGESSLDAALRESWEELHLKPEFVDTWGCMNPSLTSKLDESVVPVLAHITRNLDELRLKPHCDEVESVFVRSLAQLSDPREIGHTQFRFAPKKKSVHGSDMFYSLPVFLKGDGAFRIWGLTAVILHQVLRLLMPDVYHPTVKVVQFQNRQ